MKRIIIFIYVFIAEYITATAQLTPEKIQQFLSDQRMQGNALLQLPQQVKMLYQQNNFQPVWFNADSGNNSAALLSILKTADDMGLNEKDYQFNFIQTFFQSPNRDATVNDTLLAELKLTDAALHLYNDLAYGNIKPAFRYNGLEFPLQCFDIPSLLLEYITEKRLQDLTGHLHLPLPEINVLHHQLRIINAVLHSPDFSEVLITSNKITEVNRPLVIKLHQLGLLGDMVSHYNDTLLTKKVKEAQYLFNIDVNGKLNSTTLKELNIPLAVRKRQILLSLNYYRWLNCVSNNRSVIVVNIPAAYMKVYNNSKVILEMRMIVGKKSTPTSTLTSTVTEVILYPYWHVPRSIAVKELLPNIKRDPGFIDAGNYQVLNSSGKIMNPYAINWQTLGPGNFPYLIRQSTGCDNALGLLKVNFYNPFGAYLHDTNSRNLFKMPRRFFSHGCMRMEKPMELGHLILKDNAPAIDTLEQKGCLRNQAPITVDADDHMPVIVWYNPIGTDTSGHLIFFEDVYQQFHWR